MGRRKERRLAAISAAGRRVKLDLFAEPSGDLGDSTVQEGVGGDGDSRTRTELPSSPYSSGQQKQNPLLLLEQYSDEESEDGSTEGQNHTVSQSTSIGVEEEVIVSASEDAKHIENNDGKEHYPTVEQPQINDGSPFQDPSRKHEEVSVSGVNSDDLQQRQTNKEEIIYIAALDVGVTGDVSSGWKMVLHEESNQYYYWNIVTGETSWEVPTVFTQETVASVQRSDGDNKGNMDATEELDKSNIALDMEEDYVATKVGVESDVSCPKGAVQGIKMDDSHEGLNNDAIDGEEGNKDANKSDVDSLRGSYCLENTSDTELPSQLIKQYESLLERLNSLKGFNCHTEDKDLKLKYALEIEIRLADIKALASHGSSLLSFWLHSEGQLKRLEASVDDSIKCCHSTSPSGFDAEVDSTVEKDFATVESHAAAVSKSSNFEPHDGAASIHPENDVSGKSEITVNLKENVLPPRPTHSGEDVDMDVDMEVEDTSTVKPPHDGTPGAHHCHVPPEPSYNQAEQEPSIPGIVFSVPPVVEWIPPPPPDSEPFPPPPPDDEPFPPPPPIEPPETEYPPSARLGSVQPFPYSEQYATSYPGSGLEYFGQANLDASASTLYTHPEGGQVAVSHLPHYYEAVPNLYGVTPLGINPVDSTVYYGSQNPALNHIPLISGAAEASISQSEPVPENLDSTKQRAVDSLAQGGSSLLAKSSLNVGESGHATVRASAEVPDTQASIVAPATSSMANGVSITSTSDTTSVSVAAAAVSKAQSKVSRTKKRTVATVSSLRSNKKVSTLVDKWKAAKEELQEEEEEPENAIEILERKRQREIEEWRAQQIASGEAKDNANFQPLGGDWRERVKRRRAERMKEKKRSSPDIIPPDGDQQQIDLIELSKGLPSGWQAYWDDSTKQVYYGNVLTSETTWTRPTD